MSLLRKSAAICALALLLLLPLAQIEHLASERQDLKQSVLTDIANTASGEQHILGPILVVPYVYTDHEAITEEKTGEVRLIERKHSGQLYFIPEQLELNAVAKTESRQRGIYSAELYRVQQNWSGEFQVPANWGLSSLEGYRFEPAFVFFGVSDPRGLVQPLLEWQGEAVNWLPGTQVAGWKQGMHALIPAMNHAETTKVSFKLSLSLQGTQNFAVIPVGRETQVKLKADWPHPHFGGQFLPLSHDINAQGFNAEWQTSVFATQIDSLLPSCLNDSTCNLPEFSVSWFDGIDIYQLTDRTLKYAFLFIGLTFSGFFLYEVLSAIRLHPVQYSLVGLGLALFFLLVLALSEHIVFLLAYIIAASACIILLGCYISMVLKSFKAGLILATALSILYSILYLLLSSEDHALLLGSVLLFVCLGLVMMLTGRIDWYQLSSNETSLTSYWRRKVKVQQAASAVDRDPDWR